MTKVHDPAGASRNDPTDDGSISLRIVWLEPADRVAHVPAHHLGSGSDP